MVKPVRRKDDTVSTRPLPPFSTKSLPGSEAKIAVLAWRWENGFQLYHPDDAVLADWIEYVSSGNPKALAQLEQVIRKGGFRVKEKRLSYATEVDDE